MKKSIALLPGDGIGPEITAQAVAVLESVAKKYSHEFLFTQALVGACAIDACGDPYPDATHEICRKSDAVLFGAIGDPKYDNDPTAKVRPEQGLLKMRKSLGLFANLRPIAPFASLRESSPLKNERIEGVDLIIVRELTGGLYFGEPRGRDNGGARAFDTCLYSREEIVRVARVAFNLARGRKRHVTLVDKANVLETSRLWRETVKTLHDEEYADIAGRTDKIMSKLSEELRPAFFELLYYPVKASYFYNMEIQFPNVDVHFNTKKVLKRTPYYLRFEEYCDLLHVPYVCPFGEYDHGYMVLLIDKRDNIYGVMDDYVEHFGNDYFKMLNQLYSL